MRIAFVLGFCIISISSWAQKQKEIRVAFYNVENLFDTIDNPYKNDEEYLPNSKKNWNTEKYEYKLAQISRVINDIQGESGPDLMGLCEVENKVVLYDLLKMPLMRSRGYQIIHFESPDERGIDVALLYKSKSFDFYKAYPVAVHLGGPKKDHTRDILVAGLIHTSGDTFWVMVNHFPSRSGGQAISEPKRIEAARTLRTISDSLLHQNFMARIIAMGDFNDEPADTSIFHILKSRGDANRLSYDEFFNPMLSLKKEGKGSIMYKGEYELIDQILLSYSLVQRTTKLKYADNSAAIFSPEYLVEQTGKFKGSPFRTFGGDKYLKGFSDHFPVYLQLTK